MLFEFAAQQHEEGVGAAEVGAVIRQLLEWADKDVGPSAQHGSPGDR
ncbi:hypothetical protein [Streptomyces sp. NPDC001415]